jgi:hypothetical protein
MLKAFGEKASAKLGADISSQSWSVASDMAAQQQATAEYVGHYAEVVTINQNEYNGRVARMIGDFVNSH